MANPEALNTPSPAEKLKSLAESPSYIHIIGALREKVPLVSKHVLEGIAKKYNGKEYHNRRHTEDTVKAHLGTMEIGKRFNLLEDPVDLELICAELAATFHDAVHFRGKDEFSMTAEQYSIQEYNKAIDLLLVSISLPTGCDENEFAEVKALIATEAKRRGEEQIAITQIDVAEMRKVPDEEFEDFDNYLKAEFTAAEADKIRQHILNAPPEGACVLDIRTDKLTSSSPFRLKSKVRADVGYGGRSNPESVARAGDAEFIELDREKDESNPDSTKKPVVDVLKNPSQYSSERVAAAVNSYLGHLNQQPGFFYNRWRIDEMTWRDDEQINVRAPKEREKIITALRADAPNWKEVTMSTIKRFEDFDQRFGNLTTAGAFEGEAANDNYNEVKKLYQELTAKFAA